MERRLAAILAADVVGYSHLMGADEVGTLERLTRLRMERIEPLIATHRGRVFKLMGDGILAEFASVVDAVSCAVAWQREGGCRGPAFPHRHQSRRRDRRGAATFTATASNVAARLESLCDPGGICLSGNVHDEVLDKLDLAFQNMGAQTVKNIAEPVRAYRIVLDAAAPAKTPRPMTPRSGKPALAVLPLQQHVW